jgi:hypothetical protein
VVLGGGFKMGNLRIIDPFAEIEEQISDLVKRANKMGIDCFVMVKNATGYFSSRS